MDSLMTNIHNPKGTEEEILIRVDWLEGLLKRAEDITPRSTKMSDILNIYGLLGYIDSARLIIKSRKPQKTGGRVVLHWFRNLYIRLAGRGV
jgi:hypothetical protein